jgi:hypothetical protein
MNHSCVWQLDLNSIWKYTKMVGFIRWHFIVPLHSFVSHFEGLQMVYSYIFHSSNIFLTLFLICIPVDGYITSVIDTTYWFVADLYICVQQVYHCTAQLQDSDQKVLFLCMFIFTMYLFTINMNSCLYIECILCVMFREFM